MYPTIYHALLDLFGIDWGWTRLLNSFGFFVALAFVAASYLLGKELKRKASEGHFKPTKRTVVKGDKPDWTEVITSGAMGFVMGWKFIYLAIHGSDLFASGSNPQRFLFSWDGSFLLGLGMMLIMGGWRYWEYKKEQLPEPIREEIDVYPHHLTGNITFAAAIFGILGAKLFHLLENPREFVEFFQHPSFNSFISGLTVYGGLILGSVGVLLYARTKGVNGWHLSDAAAPGMILAYGIGRIGCQVSGDGDWGIANTAPKPGWLSWLPDWMWAYDYPNNVNYDASYPQYLGQLNDTNVLPITDPNIPCFEGYCTHLDPMVFPTPVYETIMATGIFLFLWFIRKKLTIPGLMFASYLMLNGIERFFIEKIRVNNKFDFLGIQATQAEMIAVLFFLVGAALFIYRKRTARTPIPH
jgi:phosphatidylglycerol:prolipoprotein diacylglycerol transferase